MQVVVLSPHRDDAAFSCSLTLSALLSAGADLIIVNVCTISLYAPYLTQDLPGSVQQVTAARQNEDAAFGHRLLRRTACDPCQIQFQDLLWQDAPLRCHIEDDQTLTAQNPPASEIEALCRTFRSLPHADLVLAPMAVGGHIDHKLVAQAAAGAFPGSSLVFYQDLPYACRMTEGEPASAPVQLETSMREAWLPEESSSPGAKLEYALCYPSQVAPEVAEEMERYATKHGGRERFLAHPEAMRKLQTALQLPGVAT